MKILQSYNTLLDSNPSNNPIAKHEAHRHIFLKLSQIIILEEHLKADLINRVYLEMESLKEKGLKFDYEPKNKHLFSHSTDKQIKK